MGRFGTGGYRFESHTDTYFQNHKLFRSILRSSFTKNSKTVQNILREKSPSSSAPFNFVASTLRSISRENLRNLGQCISLKCQRYTRTTFTPPHQQIYIVISTIADFVKVLSLYNMYEALQIEILILPNRIHSIFWILLLFKYFGYYYYSNIYDIIYYGCRRLHCWILGVQATVELNIKHMINSRNGI